MVAANFFNEAHADYVIGLPAAEIWKLRCNSDWQSYSDAFEGHPSTDVVAEPGEYDSLPWQGMLYIGPCSVLIFCNDGLEILSRWWMHLESSHKPRFIFIC